MYKNLKDNETEVFLDAIPKWITHYGFGLTILIFIGLVTTTSMVSYPHIVDLDVNIDSEQWVATTDFNTFGQLAEQQEITISSPFGTIEGTIDKAKAWAEQSSMYIPVNVDANQMEKVVFKNTLNCKAEVTLNNLTLLEKLMN